MWDPWLLCDQPLSSDAAVVEDQLQSVPPFTAMQLVEDHVDEQLRVMGPATLTEGADMRTGDGTVLDWRPAEHPCHLAL